MLKTKVVTTALKDAEPQSHSAQARTILFGTGVSVRVACPMVPTARVFETRGTGGTRPTPSSVGSSLMGSRYSRAVNAGWRDAHLRIESVPLKFRPLDLTRIERVGKLDTARLKLPRPRS